MTYDRLLVGKAFDDFVRTIASEFGRTADQAEDFLTGCGDYYEGELIGCWEDIMRYLLAFLTDKEYPTDG